MFGRTGGHICEAMTLERFGLTTVRVIDRATDIAFEIILCVMLLFGGYSLWDSRQVYQAAEAANYTAFRPSADNTVSFAELQKMNSDVFAWLTVNDTPIDYPVTQTDNNDKYINTNAEGQYTLSGSIFLDYRNSPDFDDFNSIIYGHHMEKKLMFGALSDFGEEAYFDAHPYGNLYFNGRDHGLEFFAVVLTDAYDRVLFAPAVKGDGNREEYLSTIYEKALYERDLGVTAEDQIIVLSTCTSSITNGRYMLFAKLTDELHPVEVEQRKTTVRYGSGIDRRIDQMATVPLWIWILLIAVLILLTIGIGVVKGRMRPEKKGN